MENSWWEQAVGPMLKNKDEKKKIFLHIVILWCWKNLKKKLSLYPYLSTVRLFRKDVDDEIRNLWYGALHPKAPCFTVTRRNHYKTQVG